MNTGRALIDGCARRFKGGDIYQSMNRVLAVRVISDSLCA